jgi:intergrase/recombinase
MQTLLGQPSLKETLNLLASIDALVVSEKIEGRSFCYYNATNDSITKFSHPTLDNLR